MTDVVPQTNNFSALSDEPTPIDTASIEVPENEKKVTRQLPTNQARERRNGKVFSAGEFQTSETPEVKLSGLMNNTEHYLELAQEAIHCLCTRALQTIQRRLEKLISGTTSMNILGPVFKDEFYVRLNTSRWAFVNESVLKSGKVEIGGVEYVLHPQDAIRIWDVISGPNDRPTLLRDKGILSLGEKLQAIVQEDTQKDLIKEGKLKEDEKYVPNVWLFLAYRRTFRNRQDPCRFISMCWDSDGTTPDRLMPVSEYCNRSDRRPHQNQDRRPQSHDRQKNQTQPQNTNQKTVRREDLRPVGQRYQSRGLNQPTQHGHLNKKE